MLDLDPAIQARLQSGDLALTLCAAIEKRNGDVVRGTMHDRDVEIGSGLYAGVYAAANPIRATDAERKSDGSVTNADLEMGLWAELAIPGLTLADLHAGLYDQANATLLLVDWQLGLVVRDVVAGTLGESTRDSDGRARFEVRGATQLLSQTITRSASGRCDVERFGDDRCRKLVAPLARTGTVTAAENIKRFTATLDAGAAPLNDIYYLHGEIRWATGANAGYIGTVRAHSPVDGAENIELLLQDEAPADIAIDDTFVLRPGCDRSAGACRWTHDNYINFHGVGAYSPGANRMVQGPTGEDRPAILLIPEADYQAEVAAAAARLQALL